MIVTLTANPSLDRTIELGAPLARGAVQRAVGTGAQPGGKGVNVSRALIASGLDSLAVLPGDAIDPMLVALRAEGIPSVSVPISQALRSNITLTEPDGTTTKVNEPGPVLTETDAAALIDLVVERSRGATWLVLAGSLPPGLPADFYARVVEAVRASEATVRVAVDSSGGPLAALVGSGLVLDLVKPNAEELAELTGTGDEASFESDPSAAYSAALGLLDRGCRAVLATLGSRGAVLATTDGGWAATMPPIVPLSTVGAGDSSLAGYLLAHVRGDDPTGCLAQSVAHGAAAAALPGSTMPALEQTHPGSASVRSIETIPAR